MRSKWRVATTALPNESRLACLITIWKSDSYFVQTQQFHVIVGLKFARRKLFAKNCCTASQGGLWCSCTFNCPDGNLKQSID